MFQLRNIPLEKIDRKILSVIEADARIPISELARKIGTSRSIADYRLRQLQQQGILRGFYCLLDPSAFGLTVWKLWVSFTGSQREKHRFFEHVASHPTMWWFAECAGSYDAVLCILATSPHDFNIFLSDLQSRFGTMIQNTAVLINVSFEYHTRGYLLRKASTLLGSSFQEEPKPKRVDHRTVQLLRILSRNSRSTYAQLSAKTGRDARTIRDMIRSLQESGVIVYFRPSIDVSKFGYEYYKVLLYLHNPEGGIIPTVIEWCRQNQHVMAVISCVGPWQLELEIEIDTFRNLCDLLSQLRDVFPNLINRHEALLVTREGNYDLDLMDKILRLGNV